MSRRLMVPMASERAKRRATAINRRRKPPRMPAKIAVPGDVCRCGYASIYKKLGAKYCNNCGGKII